MRGGTWPHPQLPGNRSTWIQAPQASLVLSPSTPPDSQTLQSVPGSCPVMWKALQHLPPPLGSTQPSSNGREGLTRVSFPSTCLPLPAPASPLTCPARSPWEPWVCRPAPHETPALCPGRPHPPVHIPWSCFVIFVSLSVTNLFTSSVVPPLGWKLCRERSSPALSRLYHQHLNQHQAR